MGLVAGELIDLGTRIEYMHWWRLIQLVEETQIPANHMVIHFYIITDLLVNEARRTPVTNCRHAGRRINTLRRLGILF